MKKIIYIILGLSLGLGFTVYGASVFQVVQGGTGRATLSPSQLIYGNNTGAVGSVATTTVTCAGSTSCTGFTVIGPNPITITSSGIGDPFLHPSAGTFATTTSAFSMPNSGFIGFMGNAVVDSTNYSLFGNTTLTLLNARSGASIGFRIANSDVANFTTTGGFGFGSTYYNLDPGQNKMIVEGGLGVGTSTPWKLLSVGSSNTGTFVISTSTSGCATFSSFGELYSTGVACGSGSGTSAYEIATDTAIAAPGFTYFEKTSGRTTIGSISTSTLAGYLFPFTSYGASTSTIIGFTNGLFSNASSTFGSTLFLPSLSQGILYTGTNGKVGTVATSSFSLSQFTNDLAALTATNASLTFSGSYNGSSARTVGLNLANTNTWSVLQNFNYSSSTVYSSFINASSTNFLGGGLTTCTGSNFLQYTSANFFLCTAGNAGTVTSITEGVGFLNRGISITTTGTLTPGIATSVNPTMGQLTYYTGVGDASNPVLVGSVATGTVSAGSSAITVTANRYAVGGALAIDCAVASASQAGCIPAASFSQFNSATTTFSTGLTYTLGTNAVTLTSPVLTTLGGTGQNTAYPINSIIASDASGNLKATTSLITLGSVLSTSTISNSIFLNNWFGVGTTTPRYALSLASSTAPQLYLGDGTSGLAGWTMRSAGNSFYISTTSATGLSTSTPAAVTINGAAGSAGYFFGTTSNSAATGIAAAGTMYLTGLTASAGTQTGILCLSATNEVINESVACVASAERFKQDIKPLNVGLSELLKLRPVSFEWKDSFNGNLKDNPNYSGVQYSLIADEVQKVDPHLVTIETASTTFDGVNYPAGTVHGLADTNHWVGFLVKSIQDLNSKVNFAYVLIGLLALWNLYLTFRKK